jgi:hypothetical protein
MPTFYIPRHSKIYPNLDSWFENKPSGNPAQQRFDTRGQLEKAEKTVNHPQKKYVSKWTKL